MVKISSITEPYFSHDYSTREKKEMKKIIKDFGYEGYGLYWAIVEFMYRNELMPGEEALVIDERYTEKVEAILNNYNLFHIENGYYISDRIIENIQKQEAKSQKAKQAVNSRWAMKTLKTVYEEIYGKAPVLNEDEISIYLKQYQRIEGFKNKLPDILYTLKCLKFDNNKDFKPSINWLLAENHLETLINGGYGKLKSWAEQKAKLKQAEKAAQEEQAKQQTEQDEEKDISAAIINKIDAIDFIASRNYKHPAVINYNDKLLMKKFDITLKEVKEKMKEYINE